MYSEKYCDDYYSSLIQLQPTYVWGANMEKVSVSLINKLFRTYGSTRYNATYYQSKLAEAQRGSGWISDCSGMIFPISQADNTAKGYYANCPEKGQIGSIDLSHSCLVFRGTSPNNITHVGYYCASNGEVMEMASSKANFQHKKFNKLNWNYWGKPSFIDYKTPLPSPAPTKPYLYKGIDVSGYQTGIDYNEAKRAGVDFAILKIIRKDMAKDKMFETHWNEFAKVGIPIFCVYNYSYATTVQKAITDAKAVLNALNGRKVAVCLDVEDKCQFVLGPTLIDIINAYQDVIEQAGLPFILYTGQSFYKSYIQPYADRLECKHIWMARYYRGYEMMEFSDEPNQKYKPMANIIGWQYTSSGHLNKCSGNYDFNVIYRDIDSKVAPVPTAPSTPVQSNEIVSHVKTNGSSLNVRNKPINGAVMYKLRNGAIAPIVGVDEVTGWFRLSVHNEEWISPDYVTSGRSIKVTANLLNVRDSDSTIGKVVHQLKKDDVCEVFTQSTNTGWYLTKYGWISNKYAERI